MKTIERPLKDASKALAELAKGNVVRYDDSDWDDVELRIHEGAFEFRDDPSGEWVASTGRLAERFKVGENWRVLKEVNKWYENLKETGPVMCEVWDYEGFTPRLGLVDRYEASSMYPYGVKNGAIYVNALPVLQSEFEHYFLENK